MDRAPIIEPTIIQFIVARFGQGMLLKLVKLTTVPSDRKLKRDKGPIIFFYSYLVVGRIHHFRTSTHRLFMVHASVLPEPRALRTVSCATRDEQLSALQ